MPVDGGALGTTLRALRQAAGLTQRGLAERAGIGANSVSELERGVSRLPHRETVELLATALGLGGEEREALLRLVQAERASRVANPVPEGPGAEPRLVGRDAELATLLKLCSPLGPPLVTLLGTGGVGKTALARAAAARLAQRSGSVAWVELRSIAEPAEMLPAVARALGVTEGSGEGLAERVARRLSSEPGLLVLDNMEHLLDAVGDLAEVLEAAPSARVLATSREALRLDGERLVRLEPLLVPPAGDDSEGLAGNPAVELFSERAAEVGVCLGAADLVAVGRVVRLLDGLPLGIELAAAQAAELSPGTLAQLLELAGLRALDAGTRGRPDRFGTMEQALRWSYRLLDPDARRLLRWLGAFRGGFGAEELAAVAGPAAAALPRLVRASLVRDVTAPGEPTRFSLLEPVRLFARQLLEEDPEEAAEARARHCAVYRDFALRETRVLLGPRLEAALPPLERERANIEQALEQAVSRRPADAARMVAGLAWWWELRAEIAHGSRWLERVAAVDADADPEDRMEVRRMASMFAAFLEDLAASRALRAEMLAIGEGSGDSGLVGLARLERGVEKLTIDHDPAAAVVVLDEAVALLGLTGRQRSLMYAHARRGIARLWSGDGAGALADFEQAVVLQGREGMAFAGPALRLQLAWAQEEAEPQKARANMAVAVRDALRIGQVLTVLLAMPRLASLLAAEEDAAARRLAGVLLGALRETCERRGIELDPELAEEVRACHARLVAEGLPVEALETEGRSLPVAAVAEQALALLEASADRPA